MVSLEFYSTSLPKQLDFNRSLEELLQNKVDVYRTQQEIIPQPLDVNRILEEFLSAHEVGLTKFCRKSFPKALDFNGIAHESLSQQMGP